ncbi:hypothetical protein GGX14DRAFT_355290 [Mycena pura]|uniref:Prokaryotic-type class I peptide chain release factors domain-containing protein n=1 Tax=Mycena pura TaxID=153505 RepID=A0AAD6YHG1_9AGAR|nr:hypothetical protein GGX14DRAFT_355290 [Mycena pura]
MRLLKSLFCPRHLDGLARNPAIFARSLHSTPIPLPPPITSLKSEDYASARTWIESFRVARIPRGSVALSFSRSSGPGGQASAQRPPRPRRNVNKVNTRATLRCSVDEEWIPLWAKPGLQRSPHYVSSSQSIQITSSVHRSQAQNIDECLSKFHALILAAASASLKNEPSEAQQKRVEALIKAAASKRRVEKAYRSSVKAGRKPPRE